MAKTILEVLATHAETHTGKAALGGMLSNANVATTTPKTPTGEANDKLRHSAPAENSDNTKNV